MIVFGGGGSGKIGIFFYHRKLVISRVVLVVPLVAGRPPVGTRVGFGCGLFYPLKVPAKVQFFWQKFNLGRHPKGLK